MEETVAEDNTNDAMEAVARDKGTTEAGKVQIANVVSKDEKLNPTDKENTTNYAMHTGTSTRLPVQGALSINEATGILVVQPVAMKTDMVAAEKTKEKASLGEEACEDTDLKNVALIVVPTRKIIQ
jgi:hypothetical protein